MRQLDHKPSEITHIWFSGTMTLPTTFRECRRRRPRWEVRILMLVVGGSAPVVLVVIYANVS
jgi:hypothetical protein